MPMVFKNELVDAQWLRAAGHSSSGGGRRRVFRRRSPNRRADAERWFEAWSHLADGLVAVAKASAADGHIVSARSAYLRASNYYRAAYTFLIGAPIDPRVIDTYRRQRSAFGSAAALMTPAAERLSIPYGGTRLHGYLFRASDDGQPRPTLIINGGYDSTAEEAYFFSGAAAVARGYTCVVFDGPGQGSAIIEDGVGFPPRLGGGDIAQWSISPSRVQKSTRRRSR